MIHITHYRSPLGDMLLAEEGGALFGAWFQGQKYYPAAFPEAKEQDTPTLDAAKAWLDAYFAGRRPDARSLSLAPHGSAFRQAVWQLLMEIPAGQVTTYGALAAKMAERTGRKTMSAQAVGGAVGHNPLGIFIPCHRVVGADGSLTGYAGGLDKKIQLLKLEGVDVGHLRVPVTGTAL